MAKENENRSVNTFSALLNASNDVTNSGGERPCHDTNRYSPDSVRDFLNNVSITETPKKEENPFSFKHFLRRDPSVATVTTSTTTTATVAAAAAATSTAAVSSTIGSPSPSVGPSPSHAYRNSTGARPKVPQASPEISRMKRSPRFQSFDSQASLAEYADDTIKGIGSSHSADFVHRSYSNYDMSPVTGTGTGTPHTELRSTSPATNSSNSMSPATTKHRNLGQSEFSAVLPDFVQDHLVMEQWYGGTATQNPSLAVDLDQLPDFAVNNIESDYNLRLRSTIPRQQSDGLSTIEFDLMSNSSSARNRSAALRRNSSTMPLDLPGTGTPAANLPLDLPIRDKAQHPIDLPLDLTERSGGNVCGGGGGGGGGGMRTGFAYNPPNDNDPMSSDNNIQRLPDFLSDGPIHSSGRLADVAQDHPHLESPEDTPGTIIARLRLENERLRHELDESRRRLAEQTGRVSELETIVEHNRRNEYRYSASLAENIGQVEENLDRSNKRAAAAQNLAMSLKQQVKKLNIEVDSLKRENRILKEEGAIGGGTNINSVNANISVQTQQMCGELLQAAANAENNLRQLLCGVDNLRIMAATLGNMNGDEELGFSGREGVGVAAGGGDGGIGVGGNGSGESGGSGVKRRGMTDQMDNEFLSDCDEDDLASPAL